MDRQVNSSALDFLLIEAVPTVKEVLESQDSEISEDDLYYRIEGYGFRVGKGLSEILTRDRARFEDQLDLMKFICKDLWITLFKKQIDNLKTNHRGTYVLIDNNFRYCQRMSTNAANEANTVKMATPYLWFPVGIVRGVLSGLGVEATVSFDSAQLPAVSFNIHTV